MSVFCCNGNDVFFEDILRLIAMGRESIGCKSNHGGGHGAVCDFHLSCDVCDLQSMAWRTITALSRMHAVHEQVCHMRTSSGSHVLPPMHVCM